MSNEAAGRFDNGYLFDGIDLGQLEESLITVDVSEGEEIPEGVVEAVDGSSDSGDNDPPEKAPPGVEKPKPKPDNLITVDTGEDEEKEEEEKPPADQTKPSKKGKEAGKDEGILSPMYLHAASLQENGLLPGFDLDTIKDLSTADQVLKINEAIQKNIEEEKSELVKAEVDSLIEPARKFYEDLKKGVSYEDLRQNATLEEQYGTIQTKDLESNEELQEAIYSNLLSMKGFSEAKVKSLVEIAKEKETLLNESTDGLKEIQAAIKQEREQMRQEAEQRKLQEKEHNEKKQKEIQEKVTSRKEIIPGMELSKTERDQIIKNMTVPIRYMDNGQGRQVPVSKAMDLRLKDPVEFELRLNYFIEKGFFDKDSDFKALIVRPQRQPPSD
ncbi:MAG: hypothetical protein HC875_37550 [Anaerolineales bacterium]|nr:hypothetical protein [Anaerolineales bacterium]